MADDGPEPSKEYAAYGWVDCVRLALTRGGLVAANNADTLMLLAVGNNTLRFAVVFARLNIDDFAIGLYFSNTQFAYGVGTPTTDALLLPPQPNWQVVAVGIYPSLFTGNRRRRRSWHLPTDRGLLAADILAIGEEQSE